MTERLVHDALLYDSDERYLGTIVPFLSAGIDEGEAAVVATHDRNRDLIARALGRNAEKVLFVSDADVYASPHAAVAAYSSVLDAFARQGYASVRAIGEVRYGENPSAWLRYEPIADEVFQDAPLHVICPYDARSLPGSLLQHASKTHPHIHNGDGRSPSPVFVPPRKMLASLPPPQRAVPERSPDLAVSVAPRAAAAAREAAARFLADVLDKARRDDVVLVIGELTGNCIRHGAGALDLSVWTEPDAVFARVRNEGPPITDPVAGFRPPRHLQAGGMGLWLARSLADDLLIENGVTGPEVTAVFDRRS